MERLEINGKYEYISSNEDFARLVEVHMGKDAANRVRWISGADFDDMKRTRLLEALRDAGLAIDKAIDQLEDY